MLPKLSSSSLFTGIKDSDIDSLLHCLGSEKHHFPKGSIIFPEGQAITALGIVLSGQVLLQYSDVWGASSILGRAGPGDTIGETYACCPGEPLQISAVAAEDTTLLLLQVQRILTTCPQSCSFHALLIQNLLKICAQKNLSLSRRILHTTPKTIRGRLLSYFSECVKREKSKKFSLMFNRQQLADYLGVDRSALSAELSKMQRDGLIHYDRKTVEICSLDQLSI